MTIRRTACCAAIRSAPTEVAPARRIAQRRQAVQGIAFDPRDPRIKRRYRSRKGLCLERRIIFQKQGTLGLWHDFKNDKQSTEHAR
ncbi:hypothetical protein [Novosphingobium sp.]|uniref:hypothetical protein n=1 Tax=Novosphingobium sp. TaxID=1874826 RepID=UPI003B52982C